MLVRDYSLFPTRLMTIQFPDVEAMNEELYALFTTDATFREGFAMHPDALNLLQLADRVPALARVRTMMCEGVTRWLRAEKVHGNLGVDVVLFCNLAGKGEFTMVHNHSADLVGVYYVRTAPTERRMVEVPDSEGEHDYFAAEDGADPARSALQRQPRRRASR